MQACTGEQLVASSVSACMRADLLCRGKLRDHRLDSTTRPASTSSGPEDAADSGSDTPVQVSIIHSLLNECTSCLLQASDTAAWSTPLDLLCCCQSALTQHVVTSAPTVCCCAGASSQPQQQHCIPRAASVSSTSAASKAHKERCRGCAAAGRSSCECVPRCLGHQQGSGGHRCAQAGAGPSIPLSTRCACCFVKAGLAELQCHTGSLTGAAPAAACDAFRNIAATKPLLCCFPCMRT